MKQAEDQEIARGLIAGDEKIFRSLFDRFHRRIFLFAFNFLKDQTLSEEVVQDTFLRFWLYRDRILPDRPITPLLFTIARRTLIDHWRSSAATIAFKQRMLISLESTRNDVEDYTRSKEIEEIAQGAFRRLNKHQKEVFMLSRDEGLTYDEIAQRLHISRHTVKYHLTNALNILREHLGKHDILCGYLVFCLWF